MEKNEIGLLRKGPNLDVVVIIDSEPEDLELVGKLVELQNTGRLQGTDSSRPGLEASMGYLQLSKNYVPYLNREQPIRMPLCEVIPLYFGDVLKFRLSSYTFNLKIVQGITESA